MNGTFFKVRTPPTNICKWFKVVIADVKFLLATSSCLMSLVMSLTVASDSAALVLISRIWEKRSTIEDWASAKAKEASSTPAWLRPDFRGLEDLRWIGQVDLI